VTGAGRRGETYRNKTGHLSFGDYGRGTRDIKILAKKIFITCLPSGGRRKRARGREGWGE